MNIEPSISQHFAVVQLTLPNARVTSSKMICLE